MDTPLVVDRGRLQRLLATQPDWGLRDFADALGRLCSWVKKWIARLRAAAPDDPTVLLGRSCARHTPPPP